MLLFLKQPWVTGASTMEGKEGCRWNRKVEAPRNHSTGAFRGKGESVYIYLTLFFPSQPTEFRKLAEPLDQSAPWVRVRLGSVSC